MILLLLKNYFKAHHVSNLIETNYILKLRKKMCYFFIILLTIEKNIKLRDISKETILAGHIEMLGHGELLELRLLEKSARHDFIIARHHSSK